MQYSDTPSVSISAPYYLESRSDNTDRTAEIEACLNQYGACLLGPGLFPVSGVRMPDSTSLIGMGTATRLLLDPALTEGFTVRIGSFCTVKDLSVIGATEPIALPETVGTRHGLCFLGTATPKDWENQPRNSIIHGCIIRAFTGGGLTCMDTGYSIHSSLTASDCHILNCGAGIHIPHFSEYHEFTNMLCCENLYGCINNGGNNVFVNCGFNANKIGFVIDNADGNARNNSHGSVSACTFNHSDNNNGIGIHLIGASVGYVFSACQVFYSKIILENSDDILFNSFNFGRSSEIEIRGGKLTMFTSCAFSSMPTVYIENNPNVKFLNCFTKDGDTVQF